jgi:predicted AlkP superfamily phosphohydrolase/phosphomutase
MGQLTKILFLGFCAAERDLLLQWAETGELPAIRSLLANGLSGETMGLPGFFVGSTWESFSTGVTPAKHGIHCWEQLRTGTYDMFRCYTGENYKHEPFWDDLSRAGRRVAILDVPLSAPSKNLNGVQLVEWGAHDAQYGFVTSPPGLAKEVVSRFGRHPWRGNCDAERDADDFKSFRDGLLRGVATKAELTKHFLRQGGWDLFAQVFTESHCVGHQCWHLHDSSHPWHNREMVCSIGDPLKDVYVAIDAAIGRLLAEVDEDTTVLMLAGHGMGPKYQAQFLLDQILLRLGFAKPPKADPQPYVAPDPTLLSKLDPALSWAWHQLPSEARKRLKPVRKLFRTWIDGPLTPPKPTIDPAAGQCFMVTNNFAHGGIRVNLIGREPEGKVAPGKEFDTVCSELTSDLLDIINVQTGKAIVKRVIRTADMYHGPYVNDLPDLLVEWTNDAPVYAISSRKIGEVRGEYRYCRSGDHTPHGLFIAKGPSILPGQLDRTVSILDFAPTLTAMLGVPLPDADGIVIPEVCGTTAPCHGGPSNTVRRTSSAG